MVDKRTALEKQIASDEAPKVEPPKDEPNYNACRKHQDKEVFGEYGQRGCEDCVFTASILKLQQEALLNRVEKEVIDNINDICPDVIVVKDVQREEINKLRLEL